MKTTLQHGTEAQESPDAATLSLALNNTHKETENFAELYISDNPARDAVWGKFRLTLANQGKDVIAFTKESVLEILFLDTLLLKADLERVRLAVESQARWLLAVGDGNSLSLTLNGEDPLRIEGAAKHDLVLEGLFAQPPKPVASTITFEWVGLIGQKEESQDFKLFSLLLPSEENTEAKLKFDWVIRDEYVGLDTVYCTPWTIQGGQSGIANRLQLRVLNGDDTLRNDGAYIRVTFLTDDYGSMGLLTAEQLKQVECTVAQPTGAAWARTADMTGKATSWLLEPNKGTTDVFKAVELIVFEFSNLVTRLKPGSSAVLIHWGGFKGRNAGHTVLPLSKTWPTPYVRAYSAKKGTTPLNDGDTVSFKEEVTLTADLFAADSFLLEAFPTERFPWPPFSKLVRPDHVAVDYKLTPAVQLPGKVQVGRFAPFSLRVTDPTATISAPIQSNGMPKLVWDCTYGECFLSGPGFLRQPVDPKGERQLSSVTQAGWYEIECARTVTARVFARLAHPFCTGEIKTDGPHRPVSWTWRTDYATSCEVHFGSFSSTALRGEGKGSGWPNPVTIVARGNGVATLQVEFLGWGHIPQVRFVEEKLPESGLYKVKWNLPGYALKVECLRGNQSLWQESKSNGEVTRDYGGQSRSYSLSVIGLTSKYSMKVEPQT
jgi:hypothetical protein